MKEPTNRIFSRQGSVLGATLIIALAIVLLLAGLMKWGHTEQRITTAHVHNAKAQIAAESVAQYGSSQIKARLERITYFPDDEFRPGNNPPELPEVSVLNGLEPLLGEDGLLGGIGGLVGGLLGGEEEGGLLGGLLGGGGETPVEPEPDGVPVEENSNYFRYEISPQNLVVGRFGPARWEHVDSSNPLYDGDPLVAQTVRVRAVRMLASAKVTDTLRGREAIAYCEQVIQVRDSPVWGNMLFYNMDLEIAPGASMEVYGPVHSNGNLFIQSNNGLQFQGMVTSAGKLYHGRAPGAGDNSYGDVSFKKADDSTLVSMKQSGAWVDSNTENWAMEASNLWAGNVRTREHGINPAIPAGMAAYTPDNPSTPQNELQNSAHVVVEPATRADAPGFPGNEIEVQKFASSACLVFEVNTSGTVRAYKYSANSSGQYVRTTPAGVQKFDRQELSVPSGLVVGGAASDKFYDARRGKWVQSVDIDVSKLKTLVEDGAAAGEWTKSGTTFNPSTEWNGIVYVAHDNESHGGVRLVNGSSIPSRPTEANGYTKGFSIATNVSAYIQGNYNADGAIDSDGSKIRQPDSPDEPPASVSADAVTILSNSWADANSSLGTSSRKAGQTEVSAALLTGVVPTNKNNNGTYSGGVENLPRFLEDWSGVKFGYRGSMVVLYESENATEPWGSSNVYNPPTRVWGFNDLFASGVMPPGSPNSRSYRRIGFSDLTAAEHAQRLEEINAE